MFFSKKLSKFKKISHSFFNRSGGKSSGIYKSLNCGPGSKDKKNKVKQNLEIVRNKINKNAVTGNRVSSFCSAYKLLDRPHDYGIDYVQYFDTKSFLCRRFVDVVQT